jgi:hypothetical protein
VIYRKIIKSHYGREEKKCERRTLPRDDDDGDIDEDMKQDNYIAENNYSLMNFTALPSPVRNCSINNQTQHSLEIQCLPGYDGGLPQIFLLELIATRSGKLR